MAAAHVASATIRKVQHDNHTRPRTSSALSFSAVASEIAVATQPGHPGAMTEISLDSSPPPSPPRTPPSSSSTSEPLPAFLPVNTSTPQKRPQPTTTTSSSSSASSTVGTNSSPSVEEPPLVGTSDWNVAPSRVSQFSAPIVGYEILDYRPKFTVFKIQVQDLATRNSWFVFRRYTDFVRLNRKVRGLFPHWRLTLPPKRWFKDNFDPIFLDSRLEGLRNYIEELLAHREVFPCIHIRDFFCFDDPPGPHECLEESKLRCECLEQQLNALSVELSDKQAEIEVVKSELAMVKAQKESLLKSLSRECQIVNVVSGRDKSLDSIPALRRTHLINVSLVQIMKEASSSSNNHALHGGSDAAIPPSTVTHNSCVDGSHPSRQLSDVNHQSRLEQDELSSVTACGSSSEEHYSTCVEEPDQYRCNGSVDTSIRVTNSTLDNWAGALHGQRNGGDGPYDGGGGSIEASGTSSVDDNGNRTFQKLVDVASGWRD